MAPQTTELNFKPTPVPQKNPLGEGKYVKSAGALIIGDEILNGKTHDTNSNYFAKFCFERGIDLKRIEVIADDKEEIVEASQRMVKNYDLVITSGGIGPTHDDITYESLAASFKQNLAYHDETLDRMGQHHARKNTNHQQNEEQKTARKRMALFPEKAEVLFTTSDLWQPVVRLEGKLCIFPGVPSLFRKMLDGLEPFLPLPPFEDRPIRVQIFTKHPESSIAPFLTSLSKRVAADEIRIGSYPQRDRGVFVSVIGRNHEKAKEIAKEIEKELDGKITNENTPSADT